MDYVIKKDEQYYVGIHNNKARFGTWDEAMLFTFQDVMDEIQALEKDGHVGCFRVSWDLIKAQFNY